LPPARPSSPSGFPRKSRRQTTAICRPSKPPRSSLKGTPKNKFGVGASPSRRDVMLVARDFSPVKMSPPASASRRDATGSMTAGCVPTGRERGDVIARGWKPRATDIPSLRDETHRRSQTYRFIFRSARNSLRFTRAGHGTCFRPRCHSAYHRRGPEFYPKRKW
jgi:hypothetical protein